MSTYKVASASKYSVVLIGGSREVELQAVSAARARCEVKEAEVCLRLRTFFG